MANRWSGPAYSAPPSAGAATGAVFATAFFAAFLTTLFVAFAGPAFFTTTFLAIFFGVAFAASALTLAQRFFVAATILAIPSLLIRRFALAGVLAGAGSDSTLIFAHLACCAAFILRLVAAEKPRRLRGVDSDVSAILASPGESIERTSAIWASMRSLWL